MAVVMLGERPAKWPASLRSRARRQMKKTTHPVENGARREACNGANVICSPRELLVHSTVNITRRYAATTNGEEAIRQQRDYPFLESQAIKTHKSLPVDEFSSRSLRFQTPPLHNPAITDRKEVN
jgi:hypothetical protein